MIIKRKRSNILLLRFRKYLAIRNLERFLIKLFRISYKTIFTFNLHAGLEASGYIAFSIIFAIFPFMIFFTILISYVGETKIGIQLLNILTSTLPKDILDTIMPVIDGIVNTPKAGILSIATLTILWSASSLVQGIKGVLNRAYRIKTTNSYLFGRIGSVIKFLLLTFCIIILIITTIVLPKILSVADKYLLAIGLDLLPEDFDFYYLFLLFKTALLVFFLFIFALSINYIIPSKQQKFKHVIWGSLLTSIAWVVSIKVLAFYLQKAASYKAVYGSLAGIIMSLFFFHILAIILVFGAEFNYHIAKEFYNQFKFTK